MGMSSPKELNYLNYADAVIEEKDFTGIPFTVYVTLSRKVYIYQRVVYDIFMMFGEVGGLWDFISLGLAPLFLAFSQCFLHAELV